MCACKHRSRLKLESCPTDCHINTSGPAPPQSSAFPFHTQVFVLYLVTAVSLPPPIDLQPPSTYHRHLPVSHCFQYTDPDIPRHAAATVPLVAASITSRLPPPQDLRRSPRRSIRLTKRSTTPSIIRQPDSPTTSIRSTQPELVACRLPRAPTLPLWSAADTTRHFLDNLSVAVARILHQALHRAGPAIAIMNPGKLFTVDGVIVLLT